MRDEIRARIEAVKNGEVPGGYIKTEIGVLPEEWAVRPLSEISSVITDQAGEEELETLSISAGIGFVNQAQKFGKELSGKQYSKYTVLQKGDFAYNKGNSKRYPQGCTYMLREREKAAVPNVFECFRIREGVPEYYEQLFIHGFMNKQLSEKINHGVRDDGLLNLTDKDFYSTKVPFPSVREQRRIAEILDMYDHAIRLRRELIEEKRKQKRGLMEKLLSPRDENDPVNAWETRTFQEVCRFINGRAYKQEELLERGKYPVLRVGNLFTKDDWYYSDLELPEHQYIENGDLIYAWSASFGPQIWRGEKVIYHYHIWKVIPEDVILKEYLYQYFQYDVQLLVKEQQGGTMSHVTKETMEKRTCRFPSIERQRIIAQILAKADQSIELSEQELSYWLEKKKALMQLLLTGLVRVNA